MRGHGVVDIMSLKGQYSSLIFLVRHIFFLCGHNVVREGRGISLGGGSYATRLGDALLLDAPDVGVDLHGRSCVSQQTN